MARPSSSAKPLQKPTQPDPGREWACAPLNTGDGDGARLIGLSVLCHGLLRPTFWEGCPAFLPQLLHDVILGKSLSFRDSNNTSLTNVFLTHHASRKSLPSGTSTYLSGPAEAYLGHTGASHFSPHQTDISPHVFAQPASIHLWGLGSGGPCPGRLPLRPSSGIRWTSSTLLTCNANFHYYNCPLEPHTCLAY